MLFCHGTGDPVVPASRGRRAYEAYATPIGVVLGTTIRWRMRSVLKS